MNIVAFDPGGTTGVAIWRNGNFSSRELHGTFEEQSQEVFDIVYDNWPDFVVCESYTITARTAQLSQQHEPLMLIGLMRFLCRRTDGPVFVLQSPAAAKGFATDAKLKALEYFSGSPGGHSNDAARHLLLHLAKTNTLDKDELRKLMEAA